MILYQAVLHLSLRLSRDWLPSEAISMGGVTNRWMDDNVSFKRSVLCFQLGTLPPSGQEKSVHAALKV